MYESKRQPPLPPTGFVQRLLGHLLLALGLLVGSLWFFFRFPPLVLLRRQQPVMPQQGLWIRIAATKFPKDFHWVSAAALRKDRVAKASAGGGDGRRIVESGLLKCRKGIGT